MAGNVKGGKPVTGEKKKRKRPSKKVPTTVLESSSTNFMDLVQQLTGSADDAATAAEKRPRAIPSVSDSFLNSFLYNNENCETSSSSSHHSAYSPPAPPPAFPQFTLDPILGVDHDFYLTGSSSSRSSMDDLPLWREPSSHPDWWYHQMDAIKALN